MPGGMLYAEKSWQAPGSTHAANLQDTMQQSLAMFSLRQAYSWPG